MLDTLAVDSIQSDTVARRRTMVADRHAADVAERGVVVAGGADEPVVDRRQLAVAVERQPHRIRDVEAVELLDSSPYPGAVGSHRLLVAVHRLLVEPPNTLAEHWLDDAGHECLRTSRNFAEGTMVAAACYIRSRELYAITNYCV